MEYARVVVVLDDSVQAEKKKDGKCDFDCTPNDIQKKYELK